ncbi:MAG: methyl-accepting chemotaxis protein [Sulfitobacter sp.]
MLPVLMISLGFIVLGALAARSQPRLVPIGAALALIGQAIAFTAAFQGHSWQIDSHMMFFALLACLVMLRSIPTLLVATVVVALHHLSLSYLMPSLIYPAGDFMQNIGRTVMHAVIVVLETAALVATVHQLQRQREIMRSQKAALEDSLKASAVSQEQTLASKSAAEAAQKEAQDAQKAAEAALAQAKEADQVRQTTEVERQKLDEVRRKSDEAKSAEQAQVVDALRVALTRLEGGDLTTRIAQKLPQEYQALGVEFNSAVHALEELVSAVSLQSEQMSAEVREISAATDDLAHRTQEQARKLTDTVDALDDLTQSVLENAKSVDYANQSSQGAQTSAQTSGEVVSRAADAMQAIKTEAGEIAKIVELIEGISFQTNLLALNAGVEAARAGEAGRGFAVVASEVRNLAQRSSESATSIRSLINRSAEQVENGSEKITETVSSLDVVGQTIADISGKMEVISGSTQEQSQKISSLNASIAEMGGVTQRNAEMIKETNAACSNLAKGAETLNALTGKFRVSDPAAVSPKVA